MLTEEEKEKIRVQYEAHKRYIEQLKEKDKEYASLWWADRFKSLKGCCWKMFRFALIFILFEFLLETFFTKK